MVPGGISGANDEKLTDVSEEDCKAACCDREWCKSFDYVVGQSKCDLSESDGPVTTGGGRENSYHTYYLDRALGIIFPCFLSFSFHSCVNRLLRP